MHLQMASREIYLFSNTHQNVYHFVFVGVCPNDTVTTNRTETGSTNKMRRERSDKLTNLTKIK